MACGGVIVSVLRGWASPCGADRPCVATSPGDLGAVLHPLRLKQARRHGLTRTTSFGMCWSWTAATWRC